MRKFYSAVIFTGLSILGVHSASAVETSENEAGNGPSSYCARNPWVPGCRPRLSGSVAVNDAGLGPMSYCARFPWAPGCGPHRAPEGFSKGIDDGPMNPAVRVDCNIQLNNANVSRVSRVSYSEQVQIPLNQSRLSRFGVALVAEVSGSAVALRWVNSHGNEVSAIRPSGPGRGNTTYSAIEVGSSLLAASCRVR